MWTYSYVKIQEQPNRTISKVWRGFDLDDLCDSVKKKYYCNIVVKMNSLNT